MQGIKFRESRLKNPPQINVSLYEEKVKCLFNCSKLKICLFVVHKSTPNTVLLICFSYKDKNVKYIINCLKM